jgi:hypothetical protein
MRHSLVVVVPEVELLGLEQTERKMLQPNLSVVVPVQAFYCLVMVLLGDSGRGLMEVHYQV